MADLVSRLLNYSSGRWADYVAWRDAQTCRGCGAAYKDRPRDARGIIWAFWATETECGVCFEKRCAANQRAGTTVGARHG